MRTERTAALVACVVALVVLFDAPAAQASGKKHTLVDLDFEGMWLAKVPSLAIGSSAPRVTFNGLSGLSTRPVSGQWFQRFAFDLRGSFDTWYLSAIGIGFAFTSSPEQGYTFDGGTATLGSFSYGEIMLPGGGVNLGEHVSLGVRPFIPILGTSGSATNGEITLTIGAGTSGLGLQGELSVCAFDNGGICAVAQPMAMIMGEPDVGLSVGLRLGL
jgi:hypothetical protein